MPALSVFNKYMCADCKRPFNNLVKVRYHINRYGHHNIIVTDGQAAQAVEEVDHVEEDNVDFGSDDVVMEDPFLEEENIILEQPVPSIDSLPYYSSFDFEPYHGQAHVYNLYSNASLDETELNSIHFREIVDAYSIPREASRELVYFFRTVLKNNLEGATFNNGKIPSSLLFLDTLENRLKAKLPVKSYLYDVCKDGCTLFGKNDEQTLACSKCNGKRFSDNRSFRPLRQVKLLSIGDQIARMLANDDIRKIMKYRHNFKHEAGVYRDYFDGEEYQNLKNNTDLFSGEDDVALALFVDGFRPSNSKKGDKLAILHLLNMNIPPEFRYKKEYMLQLCVLPGPKTPEVIDSFLEPIIAEFKDLSKYGLVVKRDGEEICKAKINLVMATGDMPAAAALSRHTGHSSGYGCRICRVETKRHDNRTCFLTFDDSIRNKSDYYRANNYHIASKSVFSSLDTFTGATFFGLEELHLIGQGLAKHVYELLTVRYKSNKCTPLIYTDEEYTFDIPKTKLKEIGNLIEKSRTTVPSSFDSKWEDPMVYNAGNRGVDWIDFLLYMVPTLFVPALIHERTKRPLLCLTKACAAIMNWEIKEIDIKRFENAMKIWNKFLMKEVEEKKIRHGVFKPTQHYLNHIPFMIRKQGVLRSYSGRSMERTIGQYKKLIKSKVSVGANAGNILERVTLYNYIFSSNINVKEKINLLTPRKYDTSSFIPLDANDKTSAQLWEAPLVSAYPSALPCDVTRLKFVVALRRFYERINIPSTSMNYDGLTVAGRCWFEEKIYVSRLYREHIGERRRGNHYIMLKMLHETTLPSQAIERWYVGGIVFFFEHTHAGVKRFLLLVDIAQRHAVRRSDVYTPIVTLHDANKHKFIVCQLEEIDCSIGLVRCSTENERKFKVISKKIQRTSLLENIGNGSRYL